MQRWTVDAASLVSLALVVAATAALPPAVALSLACCELAFAASAAVRFSVHSSPASVSAANGRKRPASSIRLPIVGRLFERTANGASRSRDAAAHFASSLGETTASGCSHAEQVASKLFDEREGHLHLLAGGQLLSQWFSGLAGPHQLHLSHVTQLLAYLLLPHNQHNYHHNQGAAQPAPAAAAGAETVQRSSASASEHADTVGGAGAAVPCPRIRSWASRLMEVVHHQPHQHPQQQQQHTQDNQPQASQQPAALGAAATAATAKADATAAPGNVKLLACTADPLVASYRPLVFYLLTEAVAAATHVALKLMGFRATATSNGTATIYTWMPPASDNTAATASPAAKRCAGGTFGADSGRCIGADDDDCPLVFLHGIGLGLTPYLRLLGRLVAASGGRRPVYAVQYKHVSMRLTATIPAPHEVAADVADFLAAQGVTRMSLLAHSYGTLIASALTKLAAASSAAPAISRLTLVDPVCFAMFLPHLVRNAIYQQPLTHDQEQGDMRERPFSRRRILRSLIKGLVVAEFHCSVALRRRLDWARVNLWPSELPPQCAVVLSGRDNLVPVREVAAILARRASLLGPSAPRPSVLLREDLGHGGFLADDDCQAAVLAAALGCSLRTAKEAVAATAPPAPPPPSVATTKAGSHGRLPLGPLVASPARQVPPVVSLAAGPTIGIEALQAVWSQTQGAYFLGSAVIARSTGGNAGSRGAAPGPAVPPVLGTAFTPASWRSAAFGLPWPLLAVLPFAGPQQKFRLAASVLMALTAFSSEDGADAGVIGPERGSGAGDGETSSSAECTRLALLSVLSLMLGSLPIRPCGVSHLSPQLPPPRRVQLQQEGARRKPPTRQPHPGSSSGSRTAPVAYLPPRAVRPVAALLTAPMPVVRAVRWPVSGAVGGAVGRVRR